MYMWDLKYTDFKKAFAANFNLEYTPCLKRFEVGLYSNEKWISQA